MVLIVRFFLDPLVLVPCGFPLASLLVTGSERPCLDSLWGSLLVTGSGPLSWFHMGFLWFRFWSLCLEPFVLIPSRFCFGTSFGHWV